MVNEAAEKCHYYRQEAPRVVLRVDNSTITMVHVRLFSPSIRYDFSLSNQLIVDFHHILVRDMCHDCTAGYIQHSKAI